MSGTSESDSSDSRARAGFTQSLRLLDEFQKPQGGVSFYTLYVNRRMGRILGAAAHSRGLSPDAVTLMSALCSLIAIVLVAVGPVAVWTGLAAGALLVLAFALDSADGQVARLQAASSARGEFLDHVLDCAVKIGLHSAVLIGWYRAGRSDAELVVPLLFLFTAVVFYFGGILLLKMREQGKSQRAAVPDDPRLSPLRATLLLPVDFGLVACSFLLWGWPDLFFVVYTALALAQTALLLAFIPRWRRELG